MRYLIKFSYDGTNFNGYQKQVGLRTVEEEIEKAVSFMNGQKDTTIYASGRTDKGVHAREQYAHFDMDITIPLYKVRTGINSMLPDDIHIIDVRYVDNDFNARYMVKEKTYNYYLNIGEYDPINRNYCYQYCKDLDIEAMKDAISVFIGEHDFRSFISSEDKRENSVRNVTDASIDVKDSIVVFSFTGNGFMKYQVRNMVGSLIEVGNGKKSKNDIISILEKKDRTKAGMMAPARGLFLKEVKY